MIFAMACSSIYHLYNILGQKYFINLLKLDLIGIGVQVFVGSIIGMYVGFHNYEVLGLSCIGLLVTCMVGNGILQSTSCYMT